ncbi:hypothetical protein [Reichenbachiella sp. MALMAid0571]|uniref:hypothetical protein n=1 Tax=Reichenbachiella sp. MALMAid0571 TaxID=3143939 RepID=UPI0032DE85D0
MGYKPTVHPRLSGKAGLAPPDPSFLRTDTSIFVHADMEVNAPEIKTTTPKSLKTSIWIYILELITIINLFAPHLNG